MNLIDKIVNDYKNKVISMSDAYLELISLGLTSGQAFAVLT